MPGIDNDYTAWAVALGIGLLVGAERERRKGEGPGRAAAGVRTFSIASLLGVASMEIGGASLLSVSAAGVLVLTALAYYRSKTDDPGLTTEIALVLTLLLGG
ncbi:MAG: MgtC/SapB family protein, partial [Hyphomicrobium sp.]